VKYLLELDLKLCLTMGGVCASLALRPRVWAHCASTGQEVNGVVLQPSHICIHIYTYMLTARRVYVVRYPTLLEWTSCSQADQAIERDKGV